MYNMENNVRRSSDAGRRASADAVEVTRTEGGVMLRAAPGAPAIRISTWGWVDFAAAVNDGEFDATLQNGDTFRTSEIEPLATDVVEVTRADDGVFVRVVPDGANAVHISREKWADFIAGLCGRVYDDTLPSAEEHPLFEMAGAQDAT